MENTTQTETKTAALTILDQINGSDIWARARWGVKEGLGLANGIQLNCNKRIKIRITLAADDTYTIEIGRLKCRFDCVKHAETEGVYADALVRTVDAMFSKAFGRL